jgi:hypothetical protein
MRKADTRSQSCFEQRLVVVDLNLYIVRKRLYLAHRPPPLATLGDTPRFDCLSGESRA